MVTVWSPLLSRSALLASGLSLLCLCTIADAFRPPTLGFTTRCCAAAVLSSPHSLHVGAATENVHLGQAVSNGRRRGAGGGVRVFACGVILSITIFSMQKIVTIQARSSLKQKSRQSAVGPPSLGVQRVYASHWVTAVKNLQGPSPTSPM